MSDSEDVLAGFVLDSTALDELPSANIHATTFADRAAARGVVLIIPATALSESWQRAVQVDPDRGDQPRELLASPMVLVDPLDEDAATSSGDLLIGLRQQPDVSAAHVVVRARGRDWPVLAADPARLARIEPSLVVEQLPGT